MVSTAILTNSLLVEFTKNGLNLKAAFLKTVLVHGIPNYVLLTCLLLGSCAVVTINVVEVPLDTFIQQILPVIQKVEKDPYDLDLFMNCLESSKTLSTSKEGARMAIAKCMIDSSL